jgi:hypothetical protein
MRAKFQPPDENGVVWCENCGYELIRGPGGSWRHEVNSSEECPESGDESMSTAETILKRLEDL